MYKGHRVISTTPAGRRRYLEILVPYLLRDRGLIDEHHFWMNTEDEGDLAYIREVCAAHPDFFKAVPATVRPDGSLTVYSFFTREYSQTDVLYLRFDDDICYIAPDAVGRLLEFRLAHREHFLVFANIVNNAYIDHLRQWMMLVEFAPFIASPNAAGNAWKEPRFAEAVHWTFLRHHRDGRLDRHEKMFYRWVCFYSERVSINCFAWLGQDMAQVEVPPEDEHFLTRVAPKVLGRPNAICGGALVCHFAFYTQRAWLEKTDLLAHYRSIAEGRALPEPVATSDRYPVEKMQVSFFTFDRGARGKAYINESIGNLARATAGDGRLGAVNVVVDGPSAEFIDDGAPIELDRMPIPAGEWEGGIGDWDVHRRIAYSYQRCFAAALAQDDCCGVLICEDDVDFRDGLLDKLQQVLDELAADGKRFFTLSLYTVGDLDACAYLDMGDLYGTYPESIFWGGQGVFFARDVIELAMEFWARHGWRDVPHTAETANDMLVGRFGHSLWRQFGEAGGHYRAYRDLVQHMGYVTSILGYYHYSETFTRPWPGEEAEVAGGGGEVEMPLLVPGESALIGRKARPEHVALVGAKAFFVPVPGVRQNDAVLRVLAWHLGVASDAVEISAKLRFPYFRGEIPEGYRGFAFVRDPIARLMDCYAAFVAGETLRAVAGGEDGGVLDVFVPGMGIGEFVGAVAEVADEDRPAGLRCQAGYLDGLAVLDLVRAENYAEEFAAVCRRMGISPHSTVKDAMNDRAPAALGIEPEVEARVREVYAADYWLLGDFEE